MFEKTHIKGKRVRAMVRVTLITGATIDGYVFISSASRVSDVLNDERSFVPIDRGEGRVDMIGKAHIVHVETLSGPADEEVTDPYRILRVEKTASDEEVRAAWMEKLKRSHPDRLAALDLAPEIVNTARLAAQRINAAYDEVMRQRKQQRTTIGATEAA